MNDTRKVFQAAWRAYAQCFPTQFEPKDEALEFSCAGIRVPLFNLAFPKSQRPISDAECGVLLQEFRSALTPRVIPGLLMARTDLLETATLGRALFRMPGMVAGELRPAQRLLPQEEIQEVCGETMAAEIARLNSAAHELTEQEANQLSRKELWGGPSHGFLIYHDGQAVAGGAATHVEGVSYIGWMATKEGHRGHGYAEAILRHMDVFMRQRYAVKESVLHATQMGLPLYERLGYRTVDDFAAILCMPAAGGRNSIVIRGGDDEENGHDGDVGGGGDAVRRDVDTRAGSGGGRQGRGGGVDGDFGEGVAGGNVHDGLGAAHARSGSD